MKAQFDDIFGEIGEAMRPEINAMMDEQAREAAGLPPDPALSERPDVFADPSFQDKIRRTLDRMHDSEQQATAAAASGVLTTS